MTSNNSTVSLLQLWRLCVDSQGEDPDAITLLEWNTLRRALEGLGCRVQSLNCSSVDEIMQVHFSSRLGRAEPVSFTWYWRGMEAILHACGVFHGNLEPDVEMKVQSLRLFRDAVLDELYGDSYPMTQLRRLYERLANRATSIEPQPQVKQYWEEKLRVLPTDEDDEEIIVTADEIANALLTWLEELLKDSLDDGEYSDEEGSSLGDESPNGSRLSQFGFATADFGNGCGLVGTSDFGGRLGGRQDRPVVPIDFNGGGTFGPGMPLPPPPHDVDRRYGSSSSTAPSWLVHADSGRDPEVRRFRDQLARSVAGICNDGSELLISQLYSAVRDVVESQQDSALGFGATPRGRASRAGILAGTRRLTDFKNRWLRSVFRDWEQAANGRVGRYDDSEDGDDAPDNLIKDLIASQAKSAEVLERRACVVPFAYRLAWLLARMLRQNLHCVLLTLQDNRDAARSAGRRSPGSQLASPGNAFRQSLR